MNSSILASLAANYQWLLSIYVGVGIALTALIGRGMSQMIPTFREARLLNSSTFKAKLERPSYAANHKWNRKWAGLYLLMVFTVVLPFSVTLEAQPWWNMLVDIVVILMFYDLCYYFMHRFLFHDNGFLGGPLKWMHAIHHRQHNPCKADSSYIHPLEVALGLGLFMASIFALSLVMGRFHVVTVVVAWTAFMQINTHNHALWNADKFPFKYLNYLSKMHHNHHARFTGGNFATISLLYDWMFGTLDNGEGYRAEAKAVRAEVR